MTILITAKRYKISHPGTGLTEAESGTIDDVNDKADTGLHDHHAGCKSRIEMTQLPIITALLKYADRLKFRQLFLLTATLFVVDLLIPDMIPFADELLLGLLTILFGAWKKSNPSGQPPIEHSKQDSQ